MPLNSTQGIASSQVEEESSLPSSSSSSGSSRRRTSAAIEPSAGPEPGHARYVSSMIQGYALRRLLAHRVLGKITWDSALLCHH
jgi:hypothetical protein